MSNTPPPDSLIPKNDLAALIAKMHAASAAEEAAKSVLQSAERETERAQNAVTAGVNSTLHELVESLVSQERRRFIETWQLMVRPARTIYDGAHEVEFAVPEKAQLQRSLIGEGALSGLCLTELVNPSEASPPERVLSLLADLERKFVRRTEPYLEGVGVRSWSAFLGANTRGLHEDVAVVRLDRDGAIPVAGREKATLKADFTVGPFRGVMPKAGARHLRAFSYVVEPANAPIAQRALDAAMSIEVSLGRNREGSFSPTL